MTPPYGIDTSVLVRLVTGEPPDLYALCLRELSVLADLGEEVVASNQVIGEAYIALQHHYGVGKQDARDALLRALRGGLVQPQNGEAVIPALVASGGAGLVDRLIVESYSRANLETLTLDRRMGSLPGVRRL